MTKQCSTHAVDVERVTRAMVVVVCDTTARTYVHIPIDDLDVIRIRCDKDADFRCAIMKDVAYPVDGVDGERSYVHLCKRVAYVIHSAVIWLIDARLHIILFVLADIALKKGRLSRTQGDA